MSRPSRIAQKIEDLRQRIRALPLGSDVGGFLDREVTEFARLLREDLALEREQTASEEVDFPPSGMSSLRQREDRGTGPEEAQGPDDPR